MLKTNLVIGTYNHLPEGVDDLEFEKTYQACYRPFLSALNKFPGIQATMFYSGGLLRRIEAIHPEYLMVLEEMSSRRQVELLGGGFYAPILPLIPNSDRLGQIEMMTTFMRKHFGRRPRGCWLPEFAWEPWLASTLQTAGMDYAFLSDGQFKEAAGDEAAASRPAITEDLGRCLTVLPATDCGSGGFSANLDSLGDRPFAALMMAGESISGLWAASGLESPDLYMEREFSALGKRALEFEMTTPSRFLKAYKATNRLYFPGSASRRFLEASSIPGRPEAKPCVRRAIIRSAASSSLHARMMHVHLLIGQLRGDKARKKAAVEELWKAQCGDAYWNAPAAGIESPKIRGAAYRALFEAELTTRRKGSFAAGILRTDIDFDGLKEYIYHGTELNAYVHPRGAVLVELDALKARRNVCDIYVDSRDEGTARRACFIDRLYASAPGPAIATAPWAGDTGFFSGHQYEEAGPMSDPASIAFQREGFAELGQKARALGLTKKFAFGRKSVHVAYEIRNRSPEPLAAWIGIECNIAAGPTGLGAASVDGATAEPGSKGPASVRASKLSIGGQAQQLSPSLSFSAPAELYLAPIRGEMEQGLASVAVWRLELAPDETWKADVTLSIQE